MLVSGCSICMLSLSAGQWPPAACFVVWLLACLLVASCGMVQDGFSEVDGGRMTQSLSRSEGLCCSPSLLLPRDALLVSEITVMIHSR